MPKTRAHQLIEMKLDRPLVEYVRKHRQGGASWHAISFDLATDTGVAVTPETLRIWMSGESGMERGRAGAA